MGLVNIPSSLASSIVLSGAAATGTITWVAKASLHDNKTLVVGGKTFEAQVTGGFVATGGGVIPIDFTACTTAQTVAVAAMTEINATSGITVTVGYPASGASGITATSVGIAGNVAISGTVSDDGVVHTGMSGGYAPLLSSADELV